MWYPNSIISWYPDYQTACAPPADVTGSVYDVLGLTGSKLRRCIAVHEAGHAVVGLIHNRGQLVEVSLAAHLGRLGCAGEAGCTTWADTLVPWLDYAAMIAAGEQAQQRWLREQGLANPARSWAVEILAAQDRRRAISDLSATGITVICGTDPGLGTRADGVETADWRFIRAHADHLLAPHWAQVLLLAEALDRHGRMTGDQVARLTKEHAGQPFVDNGPNSAHPQNSEGKSAVAGDRTPALMRVGTGQHDDCPASKSSLPTSHTLRPAPDHLATTRNRA